MKKMNKVILKGRTTADIDLRQTTSGIATVKFTIAVNRKFKDKETGEYTADFITCVAWRQQAEFLTRYIKKGQEILIEGTLQTGKYQDKNHSDITHYTTDVVVDHVEFCGSKRDSSQIASESHQSAVPQFGVVTPSIAQTSNTVQSGANGAQSGSIPFDLNEFEEILGGDSPF